MLSKTRVSTTKGDYWYIRHNNGSKCFYDTKYGNGSKSEKAANSYITDYLYDHPEETPKEIKYKERALKNSASKEVGVYKTTYADRNGNVKSFWCASVPFGPDNQKYYKKAFCVETYGETEAHKLASNYRKDWIENYKAKTLEEFFQNMNKG